jgi:hypothetical protein
LGTWPSLHRQELQLQQVLQGRRQLQQVLLQLQLQKQKLLQGQGQARL